MNKNRFWLLRPWSRLVITACMAAALQACGGGGSGDAVSAPPAPSPDPSVPAPQPVGISTGPASQSVAEGSTAVFSVTATGDAPLAYQWQRNGSAVPNATSSTYTFGPAQRTDHLSVFTVRVSNGQGSVTSSSATLSVQAIPDNTLSLLAGRLADTAPAAGAAPASANGQGDEARFRTIEAIAADQQGNVYAIDQNAVRKTTAAGVVTTLAGPGDFATAGYADGPGASARFNSPRGLAVDASGNVYVADMGNSAIRKIAPDGTVSTVAGGPGKVGSADGPVADARFQNPFAVALDGAGTLYVLDGGARMTSACTLTFDGYSVRTISTSNTVLSMPLAAASGLVAPGGIAVDAAGSLYLAVNQVEAAFVTLCTSVTQKSTVVRKIRAQGVASVLAGAEGTVGAQDGVGAAARFRSLAAITVGSDGRVFVADRDNDAIRQILPDGTVTTVAGRLGSGGGAARAIQPGSLPGLLMAPNAIAAGVGPTVYLAAGDPARASVLLKMEPR